MLLLQLHDKVTVCIGSNSANQCIQVTFKQTLMFSYTFLPLGRHFFWRSWLDAPLLLDLGPLFCSTWFFSQKQSQKLEPNFKFLQPFAGEKSPKTDDPHQARGAFCRASGSWSSKPRVGHFVWTPFWRSTRQAAGAHELRKIPKVCWYFFC